MASKFQFFKLVTCKLDKNNLHLLKKPKVLPCGNTACLECIEKGLTKNCMFKCNFDKCQSVHEVQDANSLIDNMTADEALCDNLYSIANDIYLKLQESFSSLKGEFSEKEQNIENIFNLIDNDIHIRIESIKNELDKLENDLLSISKSIKTKFLKKLNTQLEDKDQNFKYFKENIFNELQKVDSRQSMENETKNIDDENLKKNIYLCEDFLNELKNFNLNFYEKLKNISFNPSKWFPSLSVIGEIVRNDIINHERIRSHSPKLINFDKKLKSLNRIWNFNDEKLFLTCSDDNKVFVLDNHFSIVDEISEIDEIKLESPLGICSDNIDNIYLCNSGSHCVLIIDRTFTKVKRIIGKRGPAINEFAEPLDICFNSNSFYVLDRELKRVQEFSRAGDFVREIKLYEPANYINTDFSNSITGSISRINDRKLLQRPVRISISNGLMGILDSFKRVYIYNLRGEFKQLIESESNMLMCMVNEFLFTCNRDGSLICYQRNRLFNEHEFKLVFERSTDYLKSSKSFMHYFDDQLIFLLTDDKAIAIL